MPKPKKLLSPRKLPNIFRPSREPPKSDKRDLSDMSEDAKKLWEKNEIIITYDCDVNKNRPTVDDKRRNSDESREGGRPNSQGVIEIAEEVLSQLVDGMGKIVFLAQTDPSLLKVCFEIIETQRKTDDFISRLDDDDFTSTLQRPLQWELKCSDALGKFPGTRLRPLSEQTEEKTALFLQQIIETVASDLAIVKNFVEEYQQNDDYVFRNVAVAYKNHLYHLMHDLCKDVADEKQVYSILLFLSDFRQKFPKSHFIDFWQEKEGSDQLSIISLDKYRHLINRYLERQSTVVREHLSRCLSIEIKLWLSDKHIDNLSSSFSTTQWPVDVVDLCDQNLKVSNTICSETNKRMQKLLNEKLTIAVELYAAAVKYYIEPCKLPTRCKCPELALLKKERGQNFDNKTALAILNNFWNLDKHLSTLWGKFQTDESMEDFKQLKNVIKEHAIECLEHYKRVIYRPKMKSFTKKLMTEEWFPDSSITEEFGDVIKTFISALDRSYFMEWHDDVRLMVHQVYLKAMRKNCRLLKCESDDERQKVAKRLNLEKRSIERIIHDRISQDEVGYIDLLKEVADVIESTDELSCKTSVTVLKLKQKDIITKKQLEAILIIHGGFSSNHKKIIGSLYKDDK
ncbi:uncharacterized protein [Apostichopus japonicus]|uniref:uncharacterized protein isoform X2 n=1 Tax=Stichopus japonicus TaxID=307972 RepID=UPI003AB18E9C